MVFQMKIKNSAMNIVDDEGGTLYRQQQVQAVHRNISAR